MYCFWRNNIHESSSCALPIYNNITLPTIVVAIVIVAYCTMSRPFATSNAVQRGGAVQNQLAALHRDKERLEKETEQIYRNKDVTLQQLDALKTKHRNLSAKEQEHQEKLGQFDGRKDMCLKEKARVQNELQQDHNALKQWDRQAVQVEQEETTRKQAHCKKMVELAEKLEDLILQLEFARLKSMVSAETVDVLFARRAPSHRGQDQDGLAGAAAHLKEVTAERDQEKASNAALVEQLDIFRKQVLESDNGVNMFCLLFVCGYVTL